MTDAVVVLCTCSTQEEALRIADALVGARLAACVNLLAGMRSIYRWQGKVEIADEVLLLIKTTHERLAAVQSRIIDLHSYDVPEIIALPILDGSNRYLAWLAEQV